MKTLFAILAFFAVSVSAQATQTELVTSLQQPPVCGDVVVLSARSALSSPNSSFQCDPYQQQDVLRSAEQAATMKCFKAGYSVCQVMQSTITQTGYLGYQSDFNQVLGYGCLAEAVVQSRK